VTLIDKSQLLNNIITIYNITQGNNTMK